MLCPKFREKNSLRNKAVKKSPGKLFLGILILIGLWWLISLAVNSELVVPSPYSVITSLMDIIKEGNLFTALLSTFSKAVAGLLISLAIGLPLGFFMGISKSFEELLRPGTMFIRSVPIISWLSSILVIWGIGWQAPVFIVVVSLIPHILFNVSQGVKTVDVKLLEMAKIYGVPKTKIIKNIYIGSLVPFLLSAIKVSIGTMWKVAIVGEYIAGDSGMGIKISDAKFYLETPRVFAFTMVAVVCGLLLEYSFDHLIARSKLKGLGI